MKTLNYTLLLCLFSFIGLSQNAKHTIALEAGFMHIDGDIDSGITDGTSIGISYLRSLNNYLDLSVNYYHGKTIGLEESAGLYNPYTEISWFPHNEAKIQNLSVGAGVHKRYEQRIEIRIAYAIGLLHYSNYLNVLDENNLPYTKIVEAAKLSRGYDLDVINSILDDSFETSGFRNKGIFGKDDTQFYLSHNLSIAVDYHIYGRWSIGIKGEIILVHTDLLDGIHRRTEFDLTNSDDVVNRLSMLVHYAL